MTKEFIEDVRERIAQETKLMQIGLTLSYMQYKPSTTEQAEELMLIEATKAANKILSIPDIKEALELLQKVRNDNPT